MKITKRMLDRCHGKIEEKPYIVRDALLEGFGIRVTKKGTVSFICEGRVKGSGGSAKRITLGRYPAYSLDQARELAKEHLQCFQQGEDPLKVRKKKVDISKEADSYTLAEVFKEFLSRRTLKKATRIDYEQVIKYVYASIMDFPVREITRKQVEDTFYKHPKGTAGKSSRVLSSVLNYCKGIELSNGDRLLIENPVDVLKDKKISRTLKRRKTVISPEDLAQVLGRLDGALVHEERIRFNKSVVRALYIIALTGCRKQEILQLKKKDVTDDYFIIRDTKNSNEHVVPITDAIEYFIKDAMSTKGPWLFPSRADETKPINNPSKAVKYYMGSYTLHDCRRTFITVASELGIDLHQIKELVNHKSSDVTDGYIIQRIEKRMERLRGIYEQIQVEMRAMKHVPAIEEIVGLSDTGQA